MAIGLGLTSFGPSSQLVTTEATSTRWVLHTLDGKRLPTLRPDTRPQLVLPPANDAGNAHYQGEFHQSAKARLRTIPHVISTMMRHDDQVVQTELRYLTVLEQTTRFEVSGTTLQLFAAGQTKPLATLKAN